MVSFSKFMTRKEYAVAAGWRLGLFIAATVGFPFALFAVLKGSNCASIGGACGALALVIGLYVKPVIFIVFLGSMVAISVRRVRDLGLPAYLGLLVPALLVVDWQFATIVGAPWSVGFVLGGLFSLPYHFLSALLCIAFLSCVGSAEGDADAPSDRFGLAGKIALALTCAILALGLMRFAVFAIIMSGGLKAMLGMFKLIAYSTRLTPWAVLLQVVLFGYLIWQDRSRRGNTPGPRRSEAPRTPLARPVFGQRG